VTPRLRRWLFETLYKNRYLYRFASTVPFAGQWRAWQRLVLPRIRGLDVLELGCGLGDLLADMLEAGYHCVAIEQSPEMVDAARKTLRRRQVGRAGQVIQGSAQSLPFSDHSFDTVVSTFPTEYIYDDQVIAEVARVLRPGGRLIVIEGANLLPVGILQSILVLLQALVYGTPIVTGTRRQRQAEAIKRQGRRLDETGTYTEVVPNATFGRHIPLEQHGLRRRSERVTSHRWEVHIIIGEK
jgi:ubiquinone/menaquinone biosynthesis C-methylase UbiE